MSSEKRTSPNKDTDKTHSAWDNIYERRIAIKNVKKYIENEKSEKTARRYGICLMEDYATLRTGIGGTFQGDKQAALHIMGTVDQLYKDVKIDRKVVKEQDVKFDVKYDDNDKKLYMCYNEIPEITDDDDDDNSYGRFQLKGKYEHFWVIAGEVWRAHQKNNPETHAVYSNEQLEYEAAMFANATLHQGIQGERKLWQSRIDMHGFPSPAQRITAIDNLSHILNKKTK